MAANSQENLTDEELLKSACAGNEAAFMEIYRRHRESVARSIYRVLHNSDQIEDITQEVFLSLIKNADRYDASRASLRSYLIAAARNLALYHLRKYRKEIYFDNLPEDKHSVSEKGQLDELLDEEISNELGKVVDNLPPIYRNTIMLYFQGSKIADIAEQQQENVATVKTRLLRAREQIYKHLAPYFSIFDK